LSPNRTPPATQLQAFFQHQLETFSHIGLIPLAGYQRGVLPWESSWNFPRSFSAGAKGPHRSTPVAYFFGQDVLSSSKSSRFVLIETPISICRLKTGSYSPGHRRNCVIRQLNSSSGSRKTGTTAVRRPPSTEDCCRPTCLSFSTEPPITCPAASTILFGNMLESPSSRRQANNSKIWNSHEAI
jgi:hypothetical protein